MPQKKGEQSKSTRAWSNASTGTNADAAAKDLRDEYEEKYDAIVADAIHFLDTLSSSPTTMRDELNRRIKRWQDTTKSLTHTFVQELCDIHPDYEWVCKKAEEAWPFLDAKCVWWIAMNCRLASLTAHSIETSNDVAERHERIRSANERLIQRARRMALADARRRLGRRESYVPGQAVTKKPDPFKMRIGELMRKYPLWSNGKIIGKYVGEGGGTPPVRWRKHNHREGDMLDAFTCPECKHPIEAFMWRIRRKLGLPARR